MTKMKKYFFMAAAAIAALGSCSTEDSVINDIEAPVVKTPPTFTATIEGTGTRTALGEGNKVNWENGDEVVVIFKDEHLENEGTYIYEATPGVDASTATLTCKTVLQDNPAADRLFNAMYPASLRTTESDVYFPETQVYAGDNKIGFAPMSSIFNVDFHNGTVKPTPEPIEFKNATALLKITVPYTEMTSVQNITVSSDLAMYGNAGFEMSENTLYIGDVLNPGVNDHLILDCYAGNGNANVEIPADGSKIFYIAIPSPIFADDEKYGYLQIDVTDGITTKSMRTTKADGIQIKRNKIYPITFKADTKGTAKATIAECEIDVNWVQLWKDGPKFAEKNVGATSVTDKGNKIPFTLATEEGAIYLWGTNWCTPSKSDMEELLNAARSGGSTKVTCTIVRENNEATGRIIGFKYTGKETGYTENSVFFPTSLVHSELSNVGYWSSTASDDNGACLLWLYWSGTCWTSDWETEPQSNEYYVRPVLKN